MVMLIQFTFLASNANSMHYFPKYFAPCLVPNYSQELSANFATSREKLVSLVNNMACVISELSRACLVFSWGIIPNLSCEIGSDIVS